MLPYTLIALICAFTPVFGSTVSIQSGELPVIENDEKELKQRIREQHLKEMNEQVDSQGKMIADWPKYSQEVEQIKQLEDETRELEQQLRVLEQRKAELLKKQSQKLP